MKKIIVMVGNNSDKSTNRQLAQYIVNHYGDIATTEIMEVKDFPMWNKPADMQLPDFVKEQVDKIAQADGLVIVTPEYDHAPPAALLNALAWISYGVYPLVFKPVFITGASYGMLGSSRAQGQLRQILLAPEIRANVMPGAEFLLNHSLQAFDEEGNLKDPEKVEQLDAIMNDFLVFIEINEQLIEARKANEKAAKEFSWDKK